MHPKAVLLALHGLAVFYYASKKNVRIKMGVADQERALSVDSNLLAKSKDYWETMDTDDIHVYKPMDWDDVPDAAWDQLPQEMINKFLLTC